MIIKGKSRAQAAQAGKYLLDKGKNDRAELIEIKGTLSQNVKDAMREMEAVAAGSQCEKFLYHASINLKEGEQLTPEQWRYSVDLLAKNLGLEGHQRIVAEHFKDNRTHQHIIFNRVNPETLKAVHMSKSYHAHELTARQLEREFCLDKVRGMHHLENNEPPAERGPTHNEIKQAEKTGVNVRKWRAEIRQLAGGATGAELIAALEAKGHMVARGDKVDVVILDPTGTPHRMAQSLGLRVKDLKERLSDIDPANLPNVDQVQEQQKAKLAEIERARVEQEKAKVARIAGGMYDRGSMASQQQDALRHHRDINALKSTKERVTAAKPNEFGAGLSPTSPQRTTPQQEEQRRREQEPKKEPEPPRGGAIGKEKTQAEVKRDHKRAITEQTDAKQRKSAKDILREAFNLDFNKKSSGGDRDQRGNDWERERER